MLTDNDGASMRPLVRPARPTLALFLVLLVFAASSVARADDTVSAREHYQKGTSFYDLGRYAEAIQEFEAAYEIKNDPALLYNLAQSHRLAGNSEQALHFYRTYLRYVPAAKNHAEIEDRIKQLEQLVAQKNAAQTEPPAQAFPPGATPPPVQTQTTPPPPPVVTAPPETPPAMAPPPGAPPPMPEAVTPSPLSPPASPGLFAAAPPPAPPNTHHQMIFAGEITGAVGVGLFIIGAAYGGAAVGAANQVNDAAKNGGTYDPSVEKRGKNDQAAEAGFMTVGVLAAATGAVLYFYGRHLASQEAAQITPMASSTGAGASLRVTF